MNPDSALIEGCLNGRRKSQRKLYEKYKTSLFMICLRYASSRSEAEDFLQESFISIFRDLHQYDPERGELYTWMRRVTINTALQALRKKKIPMVELEEHKAEDVKNVRFDPVDELQMKELMEIIQQLPDGYRTVFNLYEIEGFEHKEIAEKLDISVGTSRSQLHKAKQTLQEMILKTSRLESKKHVEE